MVFITFMAGFQARSGITDVAESLLHFKADELVRYALGQYELLVRNGLQENARYVSAAEESIASFADGLVREETELIFAVDPTGRLVFTTAEAELSVPERAAIQEIVRGGDVGWRAFGAGGSARVGIVTTFAPFAWTLFVSDQSSSFFASVERLTIQSAVAAAVSLAVVMMLIAVFSKLITRPLDRVVTAMRHVVETGDLSSRVHVTLNDETGELADSFNSMTRALEFAYEDIKSYALRAAVSRKREMKIRNVFQKYVPNQVIEQFFAAPDAMLSGEERQLAILFSDIRGFTSFSENLSSRDIVESLNQYFGRMVDVIMSHEGVVDKYIGDALMAVFGAPLEDKDSAYHAVISAFGLLEQLADFNAWQEQRGRQGFRIGVGVDYGRVTVGNIGSERKMDYTVIGDRVNLASRLEGLTKTYREPILISESVRRHLRNRIPCRMVDRVQVAGRSAGIAVYAVRRSLSETEERAWKIHHRGMQYYYNREFDQALRHFSTVQALLPDDPITELFVDRASVFSRTPPPPEWTGTVAFSVK